MIAVAEIGMPYWIPVEVKSGVMFVDVTEPSNPEIIKTAKIDGNLISSRQVEGKLYIIQQYLPDLPPLKLYYDGTEEDKASVIAFDPFQADFSLMYDGQLFINGVRHKAYIEVNEEGTAAAASTSVSMAPSNYTFIDINRPFVFVIRERQSGTILFMGKIVNPVW